MVVVVSCCSGRHGGLPLHVEGEGTVASFKNFGFCFAFRLLIRNFADAILFLWISVIIYIVAGVGCVG